MSMTSLQAPTLQVLTLAELDANPWATCGQAALAALLRKPLAEVRHAFPSHRGGATFTNARMMETALIILRQRFTPHGYDEPGFTARRWPERGLALVQFVGSWSTLHARHPAQLQRTHWIAIEPAADAESWPSPIDFPHPRIFDVNLVELGGAYRDGWAPDVFWEAHVASAIARAFGRKATGEFWIRHAIEVSWP